MHLFVLTWGQAARIRLTTMGHGTARNSEVAGSTAWRAPQRKRHRACTGMPCLSPPRLQIEQSYKCWILIFTTITAWNVFFSLLLWLHQKIWGNFWNGLIGRTQSSNLLFFRVSWDLSCAFLSATLSWLEWNESLQIFGSLLACWGDLGVYWTHKWASSVVQWFASALRFPQPR